MLLAQLQRALQWHLLRPETSTATDLVAGEEAHGRLAIYRNAYEARLIDALAANYPVLSALLGDGFAGHARGYVSTHVSRTESIRWYGAEFAEFLIAAERSELADLARLEWAVAQAFDAADGTVLTTVALQTVEPAQWAELCFTVHASVSCVQLRSNAGAIAQAHFTEQPLPAPARDAPSHWLIWRDNLIPRLRRLDPQEARALAVVLSAGSFGELCDELCVSLDPAQVPATAASYLKTWVGAGLFSGFVLP